MKSKCSKRDQPEQVFTLPASGGFVLQIDSDADIPSGRIAGRVEHIISGNSIHFHSMEQMLDFIEWHLKSSGF